MNRYQTLTGTTASVAGGATGQFNLTGVPSLCNILKIKITQNTAGGTLDLAIYKKDTFLAADRLIRMDDQTAPALYPVDITSGTEAEILEGAPLPYDDDDDSGELHLAITNNDSGAHTYTYTITYEEVPKMSAAGGMALRAAATVAGVALALSSLVLTAGSGLTGGGDLSANRSFAVDTSVIATRAYAESLGISGLTAGKIPKAASATSLADSLISESAGAVTVNGTLDVSGHGAFGPTGAVNRFGPTVIDIGEVFTNLAVGVDQYGIQMYTILNPAVNATDDFVGVSAYLETAGSNDFEGLFPLLGWIYHAGSGEIATAFNNQILTTNIGGGHIVSSASFYAGLWNQAGSTIGTHRGIWVDFPDGSPAGITLNYGILISDQTGPVTSYNLYSAGVNSLNVFEGAVAVKDEAYGAGWNGSLQVPTKNAIYDKIESMGGGGDVVGPASATDTGVALFDGTTGKLLKNSGGLLNLGAFSATGLSLTSAAAGSGVTIAVLSSGTDENLFLAPKGAGEIRPTALAGGIARTISWGTSFFAPALMLYNGGTNASYGWGLIGGEMQFFVPSGGQYSFRGAGNFETSSAANEVMKLSAAGILTLNGSIVQTGYHQMTEMTAPGAGAANTVRQYAADVGGKTAVFHQYGSGTPIQISIEV